MNRSSKFNFYLPQPTDPISVNDFNYNFELIDQNLLTKAQSLTSAQKSAVLNNIGVPGMVEQISKAKALTAPTTLVNLGQILDDELASLSNNESESVRIVPGASFGPFSNGRSYLGTLTRSGSATAGTLELRGVGQIDTITGARGSNGWTFGTNAIGDGIFDLIAPIRPYTFNVSRNGGHKTLTSTTGTIWLVVTHYGTSNGMVSAHLCVFGSSSYTVKTIVSSNYISFTGNTSSEPGTINNSNNNYDVNVVAIRMDGTGALTIA